MRYYQEKVTTLLTTLWRLNEWNRIEYRPKVAIKPHLKPLDIADIRYALLSGNNPKWLLSSRKNLDIASFFGSHNLKKSAKIAR